MLSIKVSSLGQVKYLIYKGIEVIFESDYLNISVDTAIKLGILEFNKLEQ